MSDTQHTPTPWFFGKSSDADRDVHVALLSDLVVDGKPLLGEADGAARGEIVLGSKSGDLFCKARNAAFLERAVNCHDALLAACEGLLAFIEPRLAHEGGIVGCTPKEPCVACAARAAIAAARPEAR